MDDLTERLAAMFEADRSAEDYPERFPIYSHVHSEIGCKPWHPPAEEVWRNQGQPQSGDDQEAVEQVWALLKDLHTDYQHATGGE